MLRKKIEVLLFWWIGILFFKETLETSEYLVYVKTNI